MVEVLMDGTDLVMVNRWTMDRWKDGDDCDDVMMMVVAMMMMMIELTMMMVVMMMMTVMVNRWMKRL